MIVRYYGDAERRDWHEHMVSLLEQIYDEHGIQVEIDRIEARYGPIDDFPGAINHPTAGAVYERDLKNNRVLIENIDERPSEAYKRSGDLDVADHVAIGDDGVHWASTLTGDAYGYGPGASSKTAVDFLEDVADSPGNRVCIGCLELLDGEGFRIRRGIYKFPDAISRIRTVTKNHGRCRHSPRRIRFGLDPCRPVIRSPKGATPNVRTRPDRTEQRTRTVPGRPRREPR